MKLKEIFEGKKKKALRAPRAEQLHAALIAKKAGGHYTEKGDFKRAKEKEKFRKEMKEE